MISKGNFLIFFRVVVFRGIFFFLIKAIENLFPGFDITLEGLGEFSTVMQTLDFVFGLHNCLELECYFVANPTNWLNITTATTVLENK